MGENMIENCTSEEKLQIMRFICTFAWADLKVVQAERQFIMRFCDTLVLNDDERKEVESWLKHPQHPDDIDPFSLPKHLHEYVLSAAQAISIVDGEFDDKESELLEILQGILS
jgi:hypothetical protein